MNISEFCIRRPVFTILLMVAIMVGGIVGYKSLGVSALPKMDFPTIAVSAKLPGASPEVMASTVATPLEKAFSTIAGISSMTSSNFLGTTQIILQFDLNRNIDGAALDVQTAIASALKTLPQEMTIPPSFQKVNPASQPILFITVSSDLLPISKVDEYADVLLSRRISILPGVAQVSIYGEQKYALRVRLDPLKLAAQNIDFKDIKQILSNAVSNSALGTINGDQQLFNIKITGQPYDAQTFKELVALYKNGQAVRLTDLAEVTDDVENNLSAAFINGKRTVTLAIQRQPDANTIEVVDNVLKLLPVFRKQIPPSVELTPMFDRSISIHNSVHDVQMTLLITISLVIGIIYLFLHNIRAMIIPGLAVPLSIMATYGGMALFGFSINNISLLAITLSVGFVVDDAIVMLENIVRYIESGMSNLEAALKGSREIGFTIISITFSLLAVFIPVLFMGGIVGRMFSEFAVTISIAILASGFISLTLTPMLASRILQSKNHQQKESKFKQNLEDIFNQALNFYKKSLKWCLARRFLMLMATLATLFVSMVAFVFVPKGFFPLEDTGFIIAQSEAAQDISYEAMLTKQTELAKIIQANQSVVNVFHTISATRGAMNSGMIFIGLKPQSERQNVQQVINQLRGELSKVEGIRVFMQPIQNIQVGGRSAKSLYQYTLQSSDLQNLYLWSDKLIQALSNQKGFLDVTSDLQLKSLQLLVKVDQAKAASLGVNYDDIHQLLYNAFGSAEVANIYGADDQYAVIMEVDPEFQKFPEDIQKLSLRSSNGQMVKLDSIVEISRALGPLSVNHQGQLPAVTISFNLDKGFALGQAVEELNKVKEKISMPQNITGNFQGSAQVFEDSNHGQGMLLLLAVIVIYIILGMLYESFIHPITILSGLPSALIGAILALLVCGMDFNIISLIGVIMLIGIVKKNAIMMIDFAITAKKSGKIAEESIYQACCLRFRPIMMTTMSAIFGTLPIAIAIGSGSELRQPLGVVVVGGLLVSQVLTLYITPVIYLYMEQLVSYFKKK